jgi:predicted transcriptional regulator
MTTLSIEFPDALAKQLQSLVREGWALDEQQIVIEALRRYLDAHRPQLIETQVMADVDWGLDAKE